MSDASQTRLAFRDEKAWGEAVTTVTSPLTVAREFRFTNESLNFTHETASSEEIRSDRQKSGVVRVGASSEGDVAVEMSFGSHDPILEGAFFNNWGTAIDINNPLPSPIDNLTVTVTAVITSPIQDSIGTVSIAGSPNRLLNAVVGDWIELTLTGSPNIDGFYLVTANAAGTLSIKPSPATSASGLIRIRQSGIRNGTINKSFLIEKEHRDISEFFAFTGMRVDSWSMTIAPGSIIGGSFSFQGETVLSAAATVFPGSPAVEPLLSTTDVLNSVDNIGNILIDGVTPVGVNFTEISWTISNQLRAQQAIGTLNNIGIGTGQVDVTGTLNSYFINRTLYNSFRNFDDVELSFTATDAAGNTYLFFFPRFKITVGTTNTPGNSQDVFANMTFEAIRDEARGYTFQMNRFATDSTILLPGTFTQ